MYLNPNTQKLLLWTCVSLYQMPHFLRAWCWYLWMLYHIQGFEAFWLLCCGLVYLLVSMCWCLYFLYQYVYVRLGVYSRIWGLLVAVLRFCVYVFMFVFFVSACVCVYVRLGVYTERSNALPSQISHPITHFNGAGEEKGRAIFLLDPIILWIWAVLSPFWCFNHLLI